MPSLKRTIRKDPQSPPFREPHHSSTAAAILGGGNPIKPGEISLAHNGILFLDELPDFKRDVLEGLKEPLENKGITISRATQTLHFPTNFQLVGAFNPCPCGYNGHKSILCRCSSEQINQYQKKLSGPLLDRIDIFIDVHPLSLKQMITPEASEKSIEVRKRITLTQERQHKRQSCLNNALNTKALKEYCLLSKDNLDFLEQTAEKLILSARAFYLILKLSRTIADMAGESSIELPHISEALLYRRKEVD